ncbi:hypothetical protein IIV31_079R [Armadillidium vulgare iridescent virus]|uniref:Uncharacterized protein n=1 Tax=Armadillidium vulgare iridescent virus TaxID=72201 RepID=A0A068QKF8_9VIRU|nr:hypothetical protein IIV31_079R [Armadillidium vulgare iridescent virus]CCV02451.1 hypothetical protein IIV31_079R [Armadillidium vulgare iridescent virus]
MLSNYTQHIKFKIKKMMDIEIIILLFIVVAISLLFLKCETKENFYKVKNDLGWGGCGRLNWF